MTEAPAAETRSFRALRTFAASHLAANQRAVITKNSGFIDPRERAPASSPCGRDSPPGTPANIPIDANATLQPAGAPLAEPLVAPRLSCRDFSDYRSGDGEVTCGTWDSTPFHRLSMSCRIMN